MKIQDLMAILASVFSIILQFFGAFSKFIYQRITNEKVMNKIFDIGIDDLDKKNEKESISFRKESMSPM